MIFDPFWAYDFMILHCWEEILLLLHFSLDGARRLLCRAAQPITHTSGSGTGRLQLYRKALCCCAQSLLIRSDNLNEQSSEWRTKGNTAGRQALLAVQPLTFFFLKNKKRKKKKLVRSITLTPKWEIWNIQSEISLKVLNISVDFFFGLLTITVIQITDQSALWRRNWYLGSCVQRALNPDGAKEKGAFLGLGGTAQEMHEQAQGQHWWHCKV